MKEGIHPNYREVLFADLSNGFKFVTRSCVNTKEMETFEGKEYPLFKLDTSSESPLLHRYAKVRGQHGWPRGALPQPLRQDHSEVIRRQRFRQKGSPGNRAAFFHCFCPYSRQLRFSAL